MWSGRFWWMDVFTCKCPKFSAFCGNGNTTKNLRCNCTHKTAHWTKEIKTSTKKTKLALIRQWAQVALAFCYIFASLIFVCLEISWHFVMAALMLLNILFLLLLWKVPNFVWNYLLWYRLCFAESIKFLLWSILFLSVKIIIQTN